MSENTSLTTLIAGVLSAVLALVVLVLRNAILQSTRHVELRRALGSISRLPSESGSLNSESTPSSTQSANTKSQPASAVALSATPC